MSAEMAGRINSVYNKSNPEKEYLAHEKETDFEARVLIAYENPNTLEYTKAVDKARELMENRLTWGKMIKRGEKAAQAMCGNDLEADVVVGAMKNSKSWKKENH